MEQKRQNNRDFRATVIFFLLIVTCVTIFAFFAERAKADRQEQMITLQGTNIKVIAFTKLVIENVLESTTSIDFNTRFELQSAAEDLHDPDILGAWNAFVNSQDNTDAQIRIKNLLDLLISKITLIN